MLRVIFLVSVLLAGADAAAAYFPTNKCKTDEEKAVAFAGKDDSTYTMRVTTEEACKKKSSDCRIVKPANLPDAHKDMILCLNKHSDDKSFDSANLPYVIVFAVIGVLIWVVYEFLGERAIGQGVKDRDWTIQYSELAASLAQGQEDEEKGH